MITFRGVLQALHPYWTSRHREGRLVGLLVAWRKRKHPLDHLVPSRSRHRPVPRSLAGFRGCVIYFSRSPRTATGMGMSQVRRSARRLLKLREGRWCADLSDLELSTYFRAVDHKDLNAFGVRTLAEIDLNLLKKLPACHTGPQSHNAGFESRVTIVSYAAWRRRAHLIKQLIVAGASPTVSDRSPDGCLDAAGEEALGAMLSRRYGNGVDASTACFIIESVCRMRMVAARDAALGERLPPCTHCGADGLSVSFDPCGCVVCERCVRRSVMQPAERSQEEKETPGAAGVGAKPEIEAEIRLGEVRCPHCRAACPMRGHGVPAARQPMWGDKLPGQPSLPPQMLPSPPPQMPPPPPLQMLPPPPPRCRCRHRHRRCRRRRHRRCCCRRLEPRVDLRVLLLRLWRPRHVPQLRCAACCCRARPAAVAAPSGPTGR